MRWGFVLAVALALPAQAAAADGIVLAADQAVVPFGGTVTLTGQVTPPVGDQPVELLAPQPLATTLTAADGSFAFSLVLQAPATFVARSAGLDSPPLSVGLRPLLRARTEGSRYLGGRLVLRGTLQPASAGALTLRVGGAAAPLAVDPAGRFRTRLPTDRTGSFTAVVELAPAPGYEAVGRALPYRVRLPNLALGSRGPAVVALERRLAELRYVLRGVNGFFAYDTYEAVLAFQKVHRVSRTGRVSAATWRLLSRARVPRARVPQGDHVEIDKTRQVMFEVRHGKVVSVVHVSTGATGNTPVGRWRVYRLSPGYNALGMYYSLYFLRGFAIHGYASVPPWPASHGCVRTPLWFAPGFYRRWAHSRTVWVFP